MCDTTPFLNELAASVVREGTAPVAAVGWGGWLADGSLRVEAGGAVGRFFDLASVSKSLTAVAVARAGLDPRTPLAALVPELGTTESAAATLEQLLAHRAGLVGHLELFAPLRAGAASIDRRHALLVAASARRIECKGAIPEGGFAAVYSDLGYILAGLALARATGDLDAGAAAERLVAGPLGLELGTARGLGTVDYVPTELTAWRSPAPLHGIVHDENAMALTGLGGSGHAGLFGTAPALIRFGLEVLRMLAGHGPLACAVPPHWLSVPREGSSWRAGFDGKSATGSSAGEYASAASFGHLGFTGTSVWIDPERRLVSVLLANRVNPSRDSQRIKVTRPRVHDALFRYAAQRVAQTA